MNKYTSHLLVKLSNNPLVNSLTKSLIGLLVACTSSFAQAGDYKIEHLEPLSWWNKMASNKLQLMIHGDSISDLSVEIPHADIKLIKTHHVDSPNYLFVDVELSSDLSAGSYAINFLKNGKKVLSQQYQIKARNKVSAAKTSYDATDIIYLLTPDRFANGDTSNDSVDSLFEKVDRSLVGGRHGGDIQGIINQLGYLEDLGISQIWTNPMIENNQETYSYHGYSATDFYQIDARFGTNDLYRQLSEKAQQHNIGMIKDVVLNHIGSKHWWVNDLPTQDWLNFQNTDFVGTHHRREALHDPYASQKDKAIFTDGWFVPTMPDLNQRNPFMATYLIQNSLWWIEYANLSGLRVDTYSYSDKDFLTQWTKAITEQYPNINVVGEEWTTNPVHVAYWQRGNKTHDNYVSYLPSVLDFPLQDAIINSLKKEEGWHTGLNQLYQTLANDFLYPAPNKLVTFADNHDMSRVFTQLDEDFELYKMAMSYLLTTRGIPQIFYGTEILMSNKGTEDHGVIRNDFPGGWATDTNNGFSAKGLTTEQKQAQQLIKQLLQWRKTSKAVSQGDFTHFAPKDSIYVYFRTLAATKDNKAEKIMVIVNKNEQETSFDANEFAEMVQGDLQAKDVLSGQEYSLKAPVMIKGKTTHIWQLK